jgi:hypothetical protein
VAHGAVDAHRLDTGAWQQAFQGCVSARNSVAQDGGNFNLHRR